MKSDIVRFTHQFGRLTMVVVLVLSMFAQPAALAAQAASSDLLGPAGSGKFGAAVYTLPNGNYVVTDPEFSSGPLVKIGAVYLYDGTNHTVLDTMTGTTNNDMVGSGGIEILKDGSFVVVSPRWNNGAATTAGAATWCDPASGCPATVTAANSLVGSQTGDNVGTNWALTAGAFVDSGDITPISGSAYLVRSARWGGSKGAVTFCASGSDPNCLGAVSAANSLVGSTGGSPGDLIGLNLKLIPGGGYVVYSSYWTDSVNSKASTGAAVPCPATGCKGVISAANSLHGTLDHEQTAMSVEAFPNGAFVVSSYMWGSSSGLGAVTYCASVSDANCIGKSISASNSLVGKPAVDNTMISSGGVTILPDGNYVVKSSSWKTDAGLRTGAATFCTVSGGTSSCTGQNVTPANSLIGDWTQDSVGSAVILLSGGAFLVTSAGWHDWTGAATYCSSIAACTGQTVSSANSLVGGNKGVSWSNSTGGDQLSGGGIVVLSSGEYMVFSPHWDLAGTDLEKGAVTFCPAAGCTGSLSLANSLAGANPNDQVGMASGMELPGGALIIASPFWNNGAISQAGAVTYCSSAADCKGQTVNPANSLVGDQAGIQIGYYTNFSLANGAYLVGSPNWANGTETIAGALTWCPPAGCKGMTVSASNSLVGSHYYDYIGGYAVDLGDGLYLTQNSSWQDGSLLGAGAVTLCSHTSGCSGPINSTNSVIGSVAGLYNSDYDYYDSHDSYNYDAIHHQLLVGLPLENKVVFFMLAPDAATQPASSIGAYGATLNAAVNALNYATTVTFEYGLDTSYGSSISASQNPVTGYLETSISQVVGGLQPGTPYHYRVAATNAYGSTRGLDQTFTTSVAPPAATTGAASSITSSAARLNATVNANNASSVVTFEYGLTDSYGSSAAADQSPVSGSSATPVSKDLSGLTASTTYHFRVKAVSSGGTTYGDDLSFTTNSLGPTVTTDPASSITSGGATLNATVNALSSSTAVTFEYGLSASYGSSVTADQSPVGGSSNTLVSKAITGLAPNTQYHFQVVGVNGNGTSSGLDQTFTTAAVAPSAVTGLASGITTSGATLNGTINAFNASATVTFEYGLDDTYGSTVTADQSPVGGSSDTPVSKAISGLAPNTQYHFRLVAVNSGGTTHGLDQTFTSAAAKPGAVTDPANALSTTGATLNATVNAFNTSTTVTFEYGLDDTYGTSVTADQSPVSGSTITAVSKAVTGLAPNTPYHFRVVAVNAGGTTYGLDRTFTTSAAAPAAVTGSASGITTSGATLNGTVNALNAITTVTFEYGLDDTYGAIVTADQSPVSGSGDTPVSKSVSGLAPNTQYHYRLVTVNTGGTTNGLDSTFSTSAAAPGAVTDPASNLDATGATLNGTINAFNASTTVSFEHGLDDTYGTSVTADQSPVSGSTNTSVSKAVSGLAPNTLYHFRLVGVNAGGTTYGLDRTFSTGAAAPNAVTNPASSLMKTGATLNGTVNALNASTTVTFEYGLDDTYGSSVSAAQSPVSGSTDTPVSAPVSGLAPATTYHFRIVAVNAGGTTRGTDLTFTTAPDVCVAFGNTTVNWSVAFAACPPGTKLIIPPGLNVILDIDVSLNVDLEVQGTLNATSLQKTFTLTGSGSQTLTGNPLTFYRLTVNKDAPSDSVTISGKLKVTKKLTITQGKLISASDYGDVSIEAEGTLELTNDISVAGDFANIGTFTANGHTVTFDGGVTQNLTLRTVTSFYDLVVGPATILVETESLDNAVVSHTLTNLGTIRKIQPVAAADDYYFGLAGAFNGADLAVKVTTLGSLSSLQVDRVDSDHPNALDSSVIQAGQGRYWKVTATGSAYLANLTLPHNAFSPGKIRACRYTGTGTAWNCQMSDVSSNTITLNGVNQSADWAVGTVLDPSALNLGPTKFEILTDWAAGLKLSWNSTMEIDTAGYNLYRSESLDGTYVLLNATPIPALTPGSTSGNAYSYNDRTAVQGVHYYYRLAPVSPFKGEKGFLQLDSVYFRLIMPLIFP